MRRLLCDCDRDTATGSAPERESNCSAGIRTVSHTLDGHLAEKLRYMAFREKISESAVLEFALREVLIGDDQQLGQRMREAGATLRRKVKTSRAS